MNTLMNARGPLILTLWAFAPPIILPTGGQDTISVSFGAVAGQYELISRSCEGDVISSAGVPFQSGALLVEHMGDSPVRVSAFGGVTSVSDRSPSSEFAEVEGGAVGGGIIAYEGDRWGVGFGPVILTGPDGGAAPTGYLRYGDREGTHVRGDVFAPTALLGATGVYRAGLGFSGERTTALVGLSAGRMFDLSAEENSGPFAEITVGLTPSVHALMGVSWHEAEVHSDWGAGVGIRWSRGN